MKNLLFLSLSLSTLCFANEYDIYLCKLDNQKNQIILSSCFQTPHESFATEICMDKFHGYKLNGIAHGDYKIEIKKFKTMDNCKKKLKTTLRSLKKTYIVKSKKDDFWTTQNGRSYQIFY